MFKNFCGALDNDHLSIVVMSDRAKHAGHR